MAYEGMVKILMADIIMTYIALAYIVMACLVPANTVMAYIVMACAVIAYIMASIQVGHCIGMADIVSVVPRGMVPWDDLAVELGRVVGERVRRVDHKRVLAPSGGQQPYRP